MKLYLIRHGAYQERRDDRGNILIHTPEIPLSEAGEEQIGQLAEIFKAQRLLIEAIFTSPYPRASESAKILQKKLGIPKHYIARGLRDVDPNSANGKPKDRVAEIGGDIYVHPLDNDSQESLPHLVSRVRQTLNDIIFHSLANDYKNIALVSHGDTICAIDWELHNRGNPTNNDYPKLRDSFYLQQGEARGYEISYRPPKIELLSVMNIVSPEAARSNSENFRGNRGEFKG
jgi:broad specificity phosphatase PhoE